MKTLALIVFIYTIWQNQSPVDSAEGKDSIWPKPGECGRLIKEELYSADSVAKLNEYPWLAQFVAREANTTKLVACGAILISKRHLLAIGNCCLRLQSAKYEPIGVLLGKWRFLLAPGNLDNFTAPDCNDAKECTPPPQMYEIDEIAINPEAINNDIAVIGLTRDVAFSVYIQPICLPPHGKGDGDFVAQFLYVGGFDKYKKKTVGQVRKFVDCTNPRDLETSKARDQHYTGKFMCVSCNCEALHVISGAALMGVAVTDAEPKYYYLVGLAAISTGTCSHEFPEIFVKVSPFLEWIHTNMV